MSVGINRSSPRTVRGPARRRPGSRSGHRGPPHPQGAYPPRRGGRDVDGGDRPAHFRQRAMMRAATPVPQPMSRTVSVPERDNSPHVLVGGQQEEECFPRASSRVVMTPRVGSSICKVSRPDSLPPERIGYGRRRTHWTGERCCAPLSQRLEGIDKDYFHTNSYVTKY
jgi:hypothetical protein